LVEELAWDSIAEPNGIRAAPTPAAPAVLIKSLLEIFSVLPDMVNISYFEFACNQIIPNAKIGF
jgi:hypothetical protein